MKKSQLKQMIKEEISKIKEENNLAKDIAKEVITILLYDYNYERFPIFQEAFDDLSKFIIKNNITSYINDKNNYDLSSISKKLEISNEELINIINTGIEEHNDKDLK